MVEVSYRFLLIFLCACVCIEQLFRLSSPTLAMAIRSQARIGGATKSRCPERPCLLTTLAWENQGKSAQTRSGPVPDYNTKQ